MISFNIYIFIQHQVIKLIKDPAVVGDYNDPGVVIEIVLPKKIEPFGKFQISGHIDLIVLYENGIIKLAYTSV